MPLTVINQSGDGVTATLLDVQIQLPDSGTSVPVAGRVQVVGGSSQSISGSPLTMPAAPGSGSIFWNVQVNTQTGVATVAQSTTADPAPAANNVVVFRQTLGTTSTDPATTPASTPDTW